MSKTEVVDISKMKVAKGKNNPRLHPEKNKDSISGSIKEFGPGRSIVIDEKNNVVAGNGTVEEAIRLGKKRF